MSKRWAAAALLAVVSLGLSACGSTTSETEPPAPHIRTAVLENTSPDPVVENPTASLPVTVKGFDGVDVTITDNSRIVAADRNGTFGTTVVALGLGDNLVGRDTGTDFPSVADVPVVTVGGHSLSTEAILDLNPTVFLTDTTIGPTSVQEQLRAAGVPVVFLDPTRTLEGVAGQIHAVADALGVPAAGDALVERTETEIAAARDLVPTDKEQLKIAFLYLRGSSITMIGGEGSGADSLVEALGAIDAGSASGIAEKFVPITSEALIAAAPDMLLLMTHGLESIGGVDGLEKIPGIAQTPAGKNKQVVDMEDSTILSFGPNTGLVLQALAEAVYGSENP